PVGERDARQRVRRRRATRAGGESRVDERQLDVVQRRRPRQQVERLKDEADLFVADPGERVIAQVGDLLSVEPVLAAGRRVEAADQRSEEHTSELQSRENLVCRLLLEKKK